MTDAQGLAAFLAAVYLVECVVRVPSGAFALRRGGASCRIFQPAEWTEAARGGFVLDDLLPPFDGHALLQPWTIAVSPDGILSRLRGSRSRRDDPPVRFVAWDSVAVPLRADGSDLVVGDAAFARLASPAAAESVASQLSRIANASPCDRERAILDAIDARLDVETVLARDAARRAAVARARVSAHVVFAATLGLVLGMAGVAVLAAWWPWFLLALLPAMAWTLSDFAFAHRRLHPEAGPRRRRALWAMAASPLGAVRAVAVAGREAFAASDPLAAAAAFCDADGLREFARRSLSELRHPPPPATDDEAGERGSACEEWFRERLVLRIERFLRRRGIDPAELLAAPARSGESILGWCPRCRSQYERAAGHCADCEGIPIRAYPVA